MCYFELTLHVTLTEMSIYLDIRIDMEYSRCTSASFSDKSLYNDLAKRPP
jgi:hypothetical protein